ncbi:MAG TPA: DUF3052 domain-containing protein [Acidimicrobiales bacterium]|nr:DUF3052 domain-containing protein [Acidimicrobiales bacterium]
MPEGATATAAKLGVKPGYRVALVGAPAGWEVPGLPPGSDQRRARTAREAEVCVAFFTDAASLERRIAGLAATVGPGCALWVAWPRKAAGHRSDLSDNAVRLAVLPTGLVDVKVAAIDEDWSGLQFRWRRSAVT